jgi:hypothetical protein
MQIPLGPASSVGFRDRRLGARAAIARESSVKISHPAKDNLLCRTREVWQPRLGRELSGEDARQIVENVAGFFALLAEWSRAEMPPLANDVGKAGASENREACHGC